MDIDYGTKVIDREGNSLGTVVRIIRDSWTGEIRKFSVNQGHPSDEIMFSPKEILGLEKNKIKLNVSKTDLPES